MEQCSSADPTIALALNIGAQAVEQLGDCRVVYGGDSGVTVIGQHFDEPGVTLVVALTTGHPVAKSMRRLMRSAAGLKRSKDKA